MVVVPDQEFFTLLNVSQCSKVETVLFLRGSKALLLSASSTLNVVHPVLVDGIFCVNVVMEVTIFIHLYKAMQYSNDSVDYFSIVRQEGYRIFFTSSKILSRNKFTSYTNPDKNKAD